MAEEKTEEAEAAPEGPKPSKLPMLMMLLNTVALLAALGMFVYTKMLYKKPQITEEEERAKIEKELAQQAALAEPGRIHFKTMTVNIKPSEQTPGNPKKLHYATMAFSLEVKDMNLRDQFEAVRTQFSDQLIQHLGRKSFHELTNVQGRYILRSEVVDLANELADNTIVTDMFFSEFIVQ